MITSDDVSQVFCPCWFISKVEFQTRVFHTVCHNLKVGHGRNSVGQNSWENSRDISNKGKSAAMNLTIGSKGCTSIILEVGPCSKAVWHLWACAMQLLCKWHDVAECAHTDQSGWPGRRQQHQAAGSERVSAVPALGVSVQRAKIDSLSNVQG